MDWFFVICEALIVAAYFMVPLVLTVLHHRHKKKFGQTIMKPRMLALCVIVCAVCAIVHICKIMVMSVDAVSMERVVTAASYAASVLTAVFIIAAAISIQDSLKKWSDIVSNHVTDRSMTRAAEALKRIEHLQATLHVNRV